MSSIRRGQIAQNYYSALSCLKGFVSQTEHDLRGKKKETGFHWKLATIRSLIDDFYSIRMRALFPLERTGGYHDQ
jgi:hypothetical protein